MMNGNNRIIKTVCLLLLLIISSSLLVGCGGESFTYVRTNEFIKNWNNSAKDNPNGLTQGKIIEKSDIARIRLDNGVDINITTKG